MPQSSRHFVDLDVERPPAPLSVRHARTVAMTVLRLERVPSALLSIAFVSNATIAALNKRHLKRAGATDVIAFGFAPAGKRGAIVGDIYITPTVAKANARANGVTLREEIVRLIVHGTLHVLGYDHPETTGRERSKMWKRQEQLVRRSLAAIAKA